MSIKERGFKYNLIYAFVAQIVSLALSLLLSFVLPKILNVNEYSYWQLFVFYSTYVSCSQLGMTDGTYLKLGGQHYDELDFKTLSTQFWILFIWQLLLLTVLSVVSLFAFKDIARRFVFVMVGIYMVIYNLSRYIGLIFQAVNNTSVFSKGTLIDRFVIISLGIIIFLSEQIKWEICIIIYIIGVGISLIYSLIVGRKIVFRRISRESIRTSLPFISNSIKCGFSLMVANLASSLIIGVVRFMIDFKWGLASFGMISFAISLTNFFLLFINQISMVMFPAIRRIESSSQTSLFCVIRNGVSLLLPFVYVAYVPIKAVVLSWLPQYGHAIEYLAYLLPICIFDGKMQLLYNTYLKVLRKEKFLLFINFTTCGVSLIGAIVGAFVFNSISSCVVFLLCAIAFRSVVTDVYLSRLMEISLSKSIFIDFIMLAVFLVTTFFIRNEFLAGIIIAISYIFVFISNISVIKSFKGMK